MSEEHYLKQILPFAECRYSKNSGRQYKAHLHKTLSIGAIDQGEVIYQLEGETAQLQPGSLALINPEILHSCNPTEFCKRTYYVLYLDVDWCLQLQQSLWQIETFIPMNTVILDNGSVYQQFVTAMGLMMGEGELLEKEQILAGIMEKIFLLACDPSTENSDTSLKIDGLKRQLSMNLNEDISLRQLAFKLEANPYTLLRQFKAATGITPHAYRLNHRIELAKELLQKNHELSEVALECGFFDQSHLHHHFKAITTMTPKEYRVNFIQ